MYTDSCKYMRGLVLYENAGFYCPPQTRGQYPCLRILIPGKYRLNSSSDFIAAISSSVIQKMRLRVVLFVSAIVQAAAFHARPALVPGTQQRPRCVGDNGGGGVGGARSLP